MASQTMVLVLMASLKDLVNNLLPLVNNLCLLTPHSAMAKFCSSSNLLVISLFNSLLLSSNLLTPSLLTHNLLTQNKPTHSSLLTPSHLLMVSSLPILKVRQLDLLGGSASSLELKAKDCSWILIV